MKNIIAFICISLFFTLSTQSQRGKESWKKIKALKIAYLTEQLDLTVKEAEKFWPIYNDYSKNQNKIRSAYKDLLRKTLKTEIKNSNIILDSITEQQAKILSSQKLNTDKQLYESQKDFRNKIEGILPYKKILKLQIAEMEFGRKLMRKYKRKRPDSRD